MSDYIHAKTENVQKFLDNCLERQKEKLISEFQKILAYLHTEIIRQIQVVSIVEGRVWKAKDYYDLNEVFDNEKEKYGGKKTK